MDALQKLKDLLLKNINVPGLVADVMKDVAEPALRDAVAKTDTKLDDIALAALAPILEDELNKRIKDAWGKLLSPGQPGLPQSGDGPVL